MKCRRKNPSGCILLFMFLLFCHKTADPSGFFCREAFPPVFDHFIQDSHLIGNLVFQFFCPENLSLQKIKLQMGAGTIELDGDFKADQMEVNVGAGTLENSGSLDVKEANFTVGVGTADISELQVENLKGSCGMGDMELTLTGKAAEYNYELKCGLGNLEVDDSQETSITSGNKQITNEGATKNIKLDCGMGNVQVEFEED